MGFIQYLYGVFIIQTQENHLVRNMLFFRKDQELENK